MPAAGLYVQNPALLLCHIYLSWVLLHLSDMHTRTAAPQQPDALQVAGCLDAVANVEY